MYTRWCCGKSKWKVDAISVSAVWGLPSTVNIIFSLSLYVIEDQPDLLISQTVKNYLYTPWPVGGGRSGWDALTKTRVLFFKFRIFHQNFISSILSMLVNHLIFQKWINSLRRIREKTALVPIPKLTIFRCNFLRLLSRMLSLYNLVLPKKKFVFIVFIRYFRTNL